MIAPPSDLDITRQVRKVFVRHNINLGWITITCCRGNVQISGNLLLLPGTGGELTSPVLRTLFQEISRGPGVRRVSAELLNWTHNGFLDAWTPKEGAAAQPGSDKPAPPARDGNQVFDLTDEHR